QRQFPHNFIKKLRQMGFCFGSLYFAHKPTTSCFDWSVVSRFRGDAKIGSAPAACAPTRPEGFYGDFVRESNSPDIGLSPCRFILHSVFDRMRCLSSNRLEP